MEASSSILSFHSSLRLPWKLPLTSISLPLPSTSPPFRRLCSLPTLQSRSGFVLRAAVDVITLKEEEPTTEDPNSDLNLAKRKLYVVNLPWTYPSNSIRDMFATVTTSLVTHRYGEEAGQATQEGLHATGHAIGTAWAVFKIRKALNPKGVFKASTIAKTAAKAAADDYKTKKGSKSKSP